MPRRGRGTRSFSNMMDEGSENVASQNSTNLEGGARRPLHRPSINNNVHTDPIQTESPNINLMSAQEFSDKLTQYNILFTDRSRNTFPANIESLLNVYKSKITPSSQRKLNIDGNGLKVKFDERNVNSFKIMPWENSIPLITGYNHDTQTVKTANVEFEKFSNTQLISSRNAGGSTTNGGVSEKLYRSTIMTPQTKMGMNKKLFPKEHPMDMNNFEILNFQENGHNISGLNNVKELLNRGIILPVGYNEGSGRHEGYFIPDFASLSHTIGMEHEVGFLSTQKGSERKQRYLGSSGYSSSSNNRETGNQRVDGIRNFMKDMGEHFGFQPAELLRYSAYISELGFNPNSPYQTKPLRASRNNSNGDNLMYTHEDPTAPGVEFSLGVGTLPEMMAFEHFFNKFLLNECDAVKNPSSGYGMHMNVGVPHSYIKNSSSSNEFRKSIGAYNTLAGNVIQRLTRTKKREEATSWNQEPSSSSTSALDSGKVAIRTDSGKFHYGVIEYRFPHGSLGGDYVSNLMIMGSKMTQDMIDLHDNNISTSNVPHVSKETQYQNLRAGETSGQTADQRFVQHFLSKIGVDDPIEQKFVLNLHKQCKRG